MRLFKSKNYHLIIKLSENDVSLLRLICNLGFVSRNQLDMLYSITQGYPAKFSHHILHIWGKYSALLHKRQKSAKTSASAINYTVYVPTPACRHFLITNGIPLGKDPLIALNSHNLEAIEVVVQGLYATAFKHSAYGSGSSALISNNTFNLLEHPEETFDRSKPDGVSRISRISQIGLVHPSSDSKINQISQVEQHSEKTARNAQHQDLDSVDTSWVNKQYSTLKNYLNLPTDKLLPIVAKSLYDSAITGDITPEQVQQLSSQSISNSPANTTGSRLISSPLAKRLPTSSTIGTTNTSADVRRSAPSWAPPFGMFWWPLLANNASGSASRKDNLDYPANGSGLDSTGVSTSDSNGSGMYGSDLDKDSSSDLSLNAGSSDSNPADILGWQPHSYRDASSDKDANGSTNESRKAGTSNNANKANSTRISKHHKQRDESGSAASDSPSKGMHDGLSEAVKPVDLKKVIAQSSFSQPSRTDSGDINANSSQQEPNLGHSGVSEGSMDNLSSDSKKPVNGKTKVNSENSSAASENKQANKSDKRDKKPLSNVEESQRELDELLASASKVHHSGTEAPKHRNLATLYTASVKTQKKQSKTTRQNAEKNADKTYSSGNSGHCIQKTHNELHSVYNELTFNHNLPTFTGENFSIYSKLKMLANPYAVGFKHPQHFKLQGFSWLQPVGSQSPKDKNVYNELHSVYSRLHFVYNELYSSHNNQDKNQKVSQTVYNELHLVYLRLHSVYKKLHQVVMQLPRTRKTELKPINKASSSFDVYCSGKLAEVVLNTSTENSEPKQPESFSLKTELNNKKQDNSQKNNQKNNQQILSKNSNFNPKHVKPNPEKPKQNKPETFEQLKKLDNLAWTSLKFSHKASQNRNPKFHVQHPGAGPDKFLRGLDLISNPSFDLERFDTSSFKNQYRYQQYTFVSDETISFERGGRRQEIFVELDNRTEGNNTQVQKMLNYISYALDHPQRDILLVIAITDGSLPTNKIKAYSNIARKLSNLSTYFLRSYLPDKNGQKYYLYQMYEQAANLKIVLTGVSEAQTDIAQFILGSNYSLSYYEKIKRYAAAITKKTQWRADFIPSSEFRKILHDPVLLTSSVADLPQSLRKNIGADIWAFAAKSSHLPLLGYLKLNNKLSRDRLKQPIIAGDEHSLDTIIQTFELVYAAKNSQSCPPLIVYPERERPLTAITLSQYRSLFSWTDSWSPRVPVLLQPLAGMRSNPQLAKELRWLTIQYSRDIYNYFKVGATSKAELKKHPDYGHEYLMSSSWNIAGKRRSYGKLHQLALQMDQNDFASQLKLSEIPLGLFRTVLSRWPQGAYSLPQIMDLPYLDQIQANDQQPRKSSNILDSVFTLNSAIPSSRIQLHFESSF